MKKINRDLVNLIETKNAVIWDFDGVFCFADWNHGEDVSVWWSKLWKLLETFEPEITKKFPTGLHALNYYYEHTDYVAKKYGKKALDAINQFYLDKELLISEVSPMNEELIELFKKLDPKIENFIWSNNQEQFIAKMLDQVEILDKFKAISSRDKVLQAKPNLDGFEIIKPLTQVPISDFVFVGDSKTTDMVVAKKLGMDFFLYL